MRHNMRDVTLVRPTEFPSARRLRSSSTHFSSIPTSTDHACRESYFAASWATKPSIPRRARCRDSPTRCRTERASSPPVPAIAGAPKRPPAMPMTRTSPEFPRSRLPPPSGLTLSDVVVTSQKSPSSLPPPRDFGEERAHAQIDREPRSGRRGICRGRRRCCRGHRGIVVPHGPSGGVVSIEGRDQPRWERLWANSRDDAYALIHARR